MSRRAISAPASAAVLPWPWSPAAAGGMASASGLGTVGAQSARGFVRRFSTIPKIVAAMADFMADFSAAMADFDDGPFGELLPMVLGGVTLGELHPARQIGVRLRLPFPAYLAGL